MYLLWFAVAGQLHGDSGQVGRVGEGQKSRAGFSRKHILLILGSLEAPQLTTQQEEEDEDERRRASGGRGRHLASVKTRAQLSQNMKF